MDPLDHDQSKSRDGSNISRRSKEVLGPRPPPLKLRKDSHKIKKPPLPPREPVIIYTDSPTVIHTDPNEFMTLVQRLTGQTASSSSSSSLPSSSVAIDTNQTDKEVCRTTTETIHHHDNHHSQHNDDEHDKNCVIEGARLTPENMSANLYSPISAFLPDDSINYSMTTSPSSLDLFNNYFDS